MVGFVGRASVFVAAFSLFAAGGCASIPVFLAAPHDAGVQCTDATPCPSGQSCLQGLCYAMCDMMHPCGPREMCAGGVCVARTTDAGVPQRDVGVDGGRCALLRCMAATPVCAFDMCLQCQAATDCGGATPICDIGRGNCVQTSPDYCAPCNGRLDCAGTPTPSTCVLRAAPDAVEHVCLPTVMGAATCPNGFMASGTNCVPISFSCTAYRASVQMRPCTMDSDCPQLGATVNNGLFPHMCRDDGLGMGLRCHWPCGLPPDCPVGQTCNVAAGFCHP